MQLRFWLLLFCFAGALVQGAETTAPKKISGQVQLGQVLIDSARREVSFPAELNMNTGQLEYVLVHATGKTHESLLRTSVSPVELNAALLLLTPTPANNFPAVTNNATQINDPPAIKLNGPEAVISLSWTNAGTAVTRSASELITFEQKPGAATKWIFNSSRMADGKFMAQVTGSIISLITDPDALINNQGSGHTNDEAWQPVTDQLPAPKTPVQVTIRLPAGPPPPAAAPPK